MTTTTEPTYGQTTLAKLNEMLVGTDKANLTPTADFWAWRKENEARARVLNEAGLQLSKTDAGWTADMTKVTVESLDEARANAVQRARDSKDFAARSNAYMRSCDRANRRARWGY